MTTMWQNGRFLNEGAVFLPNDRIRLGDGVFDTMLAIDSALIHSNEHFKRLLTHAATLRIKTDWSVSDLKAAAEGLLDQNKYRNGKFVINSIISRGPAERGLKIPDHPSIQTVLVVAPAPTAFPPVHAIVATQVRRNEGSPLSTIKSCNYGDNILALAEAKEKGANEAILLNNKGLVTCAAGSNVFVVLGGKLYTPPVSDGALDGITRKMLIKRMGAKEKSLEPAELFENQGLYVSNSVRGVVPVEILDGKKLPPPSLEIDKEFHLI